MENALSAELGSWDTLAQQCQKYPALVATANKLKKLQESNYFVSLPTWEETQARAAAKAALRNCPVETQRPVVRSLTITSSDSKASSSWNLLHHTEHGLIVLPAVDGLSDLAFDKDWRIIQHDLTWTQLQEYKDSFTLQVMDATQFHLDYVADEEMTDEDVDYINSLAQEFFTENQPDADDDEIDVEFFGEEQQEEEAEA